MTDNVGAQCISEPNVFLHWSSRMLNKKHSMQTLVAHFANKTSNTVLQRVLTRVLHATILTAGAGPLHSKWVEPTQGHHPDVLFLFSRISPDREGDKAQALWPQGQVRLSTTLILIRFNCALFLMSVAWIPLFSMANVTSIVCSVVCCEHW